MTIKSRRFEFSQMKKKYIVFLLSTYVSISLVFLAEFREVRNLFPPAGIGTDNIVGFVQFYGYPPLFDLVFFCFLLSVPISILFAIILILKK